MSERKLPRVDLRKFLAGGVAGRREAVTLVGDALREDGALRVEGTPGSDPAALASVGAHLLAALADYFGLAEPSFGSAGAMEGSAGTSDARVLLLLLAGVPAGTELRLVGGEWRAISAHPGELLAVPGGGLVALTAGVLPVAEVRWPPGETFAVALALPAGAPATPLAEFGAGGAIRGS